MKLTVLFCFKKNSFDLLHENPQRFKNLFLIYKLLLPDIFLTILITESLLRQEQLNF